MTINTPSEQFDNAAPANGIVSAVSRLFGGKAKDEEVVVPPGSQKAHSVIASLQEWGLYPSPDAYRLAWEYHFGNCTELCEAIDEAVREGKTLSPNILRSIVEKHHRGWSEDEVLRLFDESKAFLRQGHDVISQNRSDSREFGSELEKTAARMREEEQAVNNSSRSIMQGASQSINALISLTQVMAEKSLAAEAELLEAENHLENMRKELADVTKKAETDQLTGLPNRWSFEASLNEATKWAIDTGLPLSIALIDIDNFKLINDTHGHPTGDRVLRRIASLLDGLTSDNCHVARHGGEEFIILFRKKQANEAMRAVDDLRFKLSAKNFTDRETGEEIGKISFSAGVASLQDDHDTQSMLKRSDAALYQAKKFGRNRVVIDCS